MFDALKKLFLMVMVLLTLAFTVMMFCFGLSVIVLGLVSLLFFQEILCNYLFMYTVCSLQLFFLHIHWFRTILHICLFCFPDHTDASIICVTILVLTFGHKLRNQRCVSVYVHLCICTCMSEVGRRGGGGRGGREGAGGRGRGGQKSFEALCQHCFDYDYEIFCGHSVSIH